MTNYSLVFNVTCWLICFFCAGAMLGQPSHFNDFFDADAGWKRADATHPDSMHFYIQDGSLFLVNKQRSAGIVELKMPFSGDLSTDAEWQLRIKMRHISGVNSYNYGVCQGAIPGTSFTDGLSFGMAANGYYRIDNYLGQKKHEIKAWTQYGPINTADSTVNELRIIYRAPWGFFLLINGNWAFMGRGGGHKNKTLCLFAEGHQTIAFDAIELVSYKGQFTKMPDVRTVELQEICTAAVDSFSKARGFVQDTAYKTWLPEIFICNRDYKIFKKATGVFPPRISRGRGFYVYSISTDFKDMADRDAKKASLEAIITSAFGSVKQSKATFSDKKSVYFFAKSPNVPAGSIAILQEYSARRSYEKEDHYYLDLIVLNAPDIKPF